MILYMSSGCTSYWGCVSSLHSHKEESIKQPIFNMMLQAVPLLLRTAGNVADKE